MLPRTAAAPIASAARVSSPAETRCSGRRVVAAAGTLRRRLRSASNAMTPTRATLTRISWPYPVDTSSSHDPSATMLRADAGRDDDGERDRRDQREPPHRERLVGRRRASYADQQRGETADPDARGREMRPLRRGRRPPLDARRCRGVSRCDMNRDHHRGRSGRDRERDPRGRQHVRAARDTNSATPTTTSASARPWTARPAYVSKNAAKPTPALERWANIRITRPSAVTGHATAASGNSSPRAGEAGRAGERRAEQHDDAGQEQEAVRGSRPRTRPGCWCSSPRCASCACSGVTPTPNE